MLYGFSNLFEPVIIQFFIMYLEKFIQMQRIINNVSEKNVTIFMFIPMQIATLAQGKPWSEETSSARNHRPFTSASSNLSAGGGMRQSASYPRMSAHSSDAGYNGGGGGGYQESLSRYIVWS